MTALRLASALVALAALAAGEAVPFSLTDSSARDLVAEAAALRSDAGGTPSEVRLWAALSPTPPLRLRFHAWARDVDLELQPAASSLAPGAQVSMGSSKHELSATPVFRGPGHSAVLSVVGEHLRGLVRIGGAFASVEADPATGELQISPQHRPAAWHPNTAGKALRRLEFDPDAIERWTDCYTNDAVTRSFSMGVAMGSALYSRFGNVDDAMEWLQSIFAEANLVYTPQMNFVLTISEVFIPDVSGQKDWDDCGQGIDDQLTALQRWDPLAEDPPLSRQGLWHLFDDCIDPSATSFTSGLASIGTASAGMCQMEPMFCDPEENLCYTNSDWCNSPSCFQRYTNTGVTYYYGADTWGTFAHEVGHNFGADHSFDEGKGDTGGIMDYGDGTFEGIFQFNSQYTKEEMCATISRRVEQGCPAISAYAPECGNGILEDGEECDCETGTDCAWCSECNLAAGKQCTPDGLSPGAADSECCASSGLLHEDGVACTQMDGTTGSCSQGACGARLTTGGCVCWKSWRFTGYPECTDYCCNPDSDSNGDWCFTEDSCGGPGWGYCDSLVTRSPTSAPTSAPTSPEPTTAPTPSPTLGPGETSEPTAAPTPSPPTDAPTPAPTLVPGETYEPTATPTQAPTDAPTRPVDGDSATDGSDASTTLGASGEFDGLEIDSAASARAVAGFVIAFGVALAA